MVCASYIWALGKSFGFMFFYSISSRGVWDPERWHLDKRGSETPPDEVAQGNNMGDTHKVCTIDMSRLLVKSITYE